MLMAGQVDDLRWHAANGGFETAADQVGGHCLIWLGVLDLLVVGAVGARRVPSPWYVGYRLLLASGLIVVGRLLRRAWTTYRWEGRPRRRP